MGNTCLKVESITKRFGGLKAVDSLSFEVQEGEILGLIGPNGSGKTTTINMLSGLYPVSSGKIFFYGQETQAMKPHEINRIGLARTFQNIRLFQSLTVRKNVMVARYHESRINLMDVLFGGRNNSHMLQCNHGCDEMLELIHLKEKADWYANELPYGQQKCLEIARALATHPKFLLLDEPAAGLNATEVNLLKEIIVKIRQMGVTVLVVEHHMDLIMEICTRIVVLNHGKKIAEGTPEEIQNDEEVIKAYLGDQYKKNA